MILAANLVALRPRPDGMGMAGLDHRGAIGPYPPPRSGFGWGGPCGLADGSWRAIDLLRNARLQIMLARRERRTRGRGRINPEFADHFSLRPRI